MAGYLGKKSESKPEPKGEVATLLGLRKTPKGFEVVQAKTSDVTVLSPAQGLEWASGELLLALRKMMAVL